jgi:hypothetical protein
VSNENPANTTQTGSLMFGVEMSHKDCRLGQITSQGQSRVQGVQRVQCLAAISWKVFAFSCILLVEPHCKISMIKISEEQA